MNSSIVPLLGGALVGTIIVLLIVVIAAQFVGGSWEHGEDDK